MLAVSPLGNTKDEREGEMDTLQMGAADATDDFPDFSGGSLLDSIDFDDLFIGINDGDVLPDLEMDSELLAEFSVSGGEEYSDLNTSASVEKVENNSTRKEEEEEDKVSNSGSGSGSGSGLGSGSSRGEEIVSKREESGAGNIPSTKGNDKGRKSSAQSKNSSQGKRKVKVDWTPELHRRFVQAVEQLGVDKAVPSRILELMGIDCLTRHNIASHLQKYRSHRKHLLAREAEAASWSQRRQMYGGATATATATGGGSKRDMSPWLAPPTMGFPHMTPMHPFRPLHVWGHPSMDQSLMHMWPKHLAPSPSPPPPPPPTWAPVPPPPPLPPPDPSYWYPPHHQRVPNGLSPGTPCFPPPLTTTRFAAPPVPGIPPHAMYKADPGIGVPARQSGPHPPPFDFHPSNESIDAAIGDVLSKPWLPLPIGLKPPSIDGVLVELHRQGVPKVPPTCSA